MRKNLISNKRLTFQIISAMIILSIITILTSSFYIKQTALDRLAKDDAKKTSELIFEIMNTKMQEGWGKEDLKIILKKLGHIRNGLVVHSYRSPLVEEILGKNIEDALLVKNDPKIQNAMHGKEQFIVEDNGSIRYLYPIHVQKECITCHHNAKVGDINGVLDIKYPPSEIKISLNQLTYWFIGFFIFFVLISFYIFYALVSKKIINPIIEITDTIQRLSEEKDLNKKANINTNIKEIESLQDSFNNLLSTIKYYYEKLLKNFYIDDLTQLPNMNQLQKDLQTYLESPLAIINIDSFREFNNFYGVQVGDFIIKELANFLDKNSLEHTRVYRLHGDEFALLFTQNISIDECKKLIHHIEQHEFKYKKINIFIHITMGIVFENKNKRRVEEATIALKNAKKNQKTFKIFKDSLSLQNEYQQNIKWTKLLKEAIDNNNIVPFYQPIKEVSTGQILKYESLARLYKDGKYYSPIEFLEVSKKAKLYPKITHIMMEKSFEYFSSKPQINFSINFSIEDIQNAQTVEYLFELIQQYDIGKRLIIELLETEEINDFELLNNFITRAKRYHVQFAIDDFGSGYSNFSYIINLNVDYLKIDSSLIENLHTSEDSLKVVKTIVSFAKEIGLKTIAEKVHNEEIEKILIDLQVDYLQGYLIGKPELQTL